MNWPLHFSEPTALMKRSAIRELLKVACRPGMISFAGGVPAPELFPVEEISRAMQTVLAQSGERALQYGETEGLGELRDWIAANLSGSRLALTRKNVVILSGSQQGLDLLGRVLLNSRDAVVVENPTYLALLSAWRPMGVQFVPVASDCDGLQIDGLERLLACRPKLLYVIPNFQNPQGTTLSFDRRKRLVDLCRQHEIGIVEDNPYGELRYSGEALPHLLQIEADLNSAIGKENHVIHVGTFSKVLCPGLRIGWAVGPEEVIDKIVQAKQAADLHTSTLGQFLVLELVRNGLLDRHIPRLRTAYRERRDAMLAALRCHFPDEITWTHPDGGLFLMVTLPGGIDATEVLARAIERKVAFVPGEDFHLDGAGTNTFRLSFSTATSDAIHEGIARLAAVLKDFLSGHFGREIRSSASPK